MKILDFLEIDNDKLPELFYKNIELNNINEIDFNILKAFYTLKYNNPDNPIINFSDVASALTILHSNDNLDFWFFYNLLESRASHLIYLPFIWDLNEEIDEIINKGEDLETIKMLEQYRRDGGKGEMKCHFIAASLISYLNPDGSVIRSFLSPSNCFDDLYFYALNLKPEKEQENNKDVFQ